MGAQSIPLINQFYGLQVPTGVASPIPQESKKELSPQTNSYVRLRLSLLRLLRHYFHDCFHHSHFIKYIHLYGKSEYSPVWEIRIFTCMGNQDIHLYGQSGYSPIWEIRIFTCMGNQDIQLYGKSGYSPEWEIRIFTCMGNQDIHLRGKS